MNGLLIAFEGIDGAGKAIQSRLLSEALRGLGRPVLVQSFPHYLSASGELIRDHLAGRWSVSWPSLPRVDSATEANLRVRQSLMLVNMGELDATIRHAVSDGSDVVLDRWWASAVAYGHAEGLDPDPLLASASVLARPDAWILLDIEPALGRSRRPGPARDLNEGDLAKLARARASYRALFSARGLPGSAYPGEGVAPAAVVDASSPPERVHASVLEALQTLLGKRFPVR